MRRSLFLLLLLLACSFSIGIAMAQAQEVKGRVEAAGAGLRQVTVTVRGTGAQAATDEKGEFTVRAGIGSTLVFTHFGYQTKEVTLQNLNYLNVTLETLDEAIEQVVVTGIGMQVDKRLFTGATTKISGSATEIGGNLDPSRGLEGRVSGVSVSNPTGTFGTAPRLRIRGATSIYGSSKPLWVVDGMIVEDVADVSSDELSSGDALTLISSAVAGLNVNDIESFQVLKDGSATSIYGARGMAGVIVITTKRGAVGRSTINYTAEFTSRAVPRYSEFNIMNSQEQMSVYKDIYDKGYLRMAGTSNASNSGIYGKMYELINTGKMINDLNTTQVEMNKFLREGEFRNTDWFGELFSNNIQQNHAISLSSGNEKSQYYASLSFIDDKGWSKRSGVKRYTANLNANYNILKNLTLNLLANGSSREQEAPGTVGQSTDVVFGEVKRDFEINPYSYAMNTSRTLDPNTFYTRNFAPFNILHELDQNYMDVNVNELKFVGDLKWKPIEGMQLGAFAAYRISSTTQHHYIKDRSNQAMAHRWAPTTVIRDANPYFYRDPENPLAVPISILPEGGIYNRTDHKISDQVFRLNAQYDKVIDKHRMFAFLGGEVTSLERNNTWFRGWGLQYDLGESPFSSYMAFKRGQQENTPYFYMGNSRYRQVAAFTSLIYTYDERYTFKVDGRYEGTNRFGKTRRSRWMPTWNVSGLWNVHNEEFFRESQDLISHLVLKASYSLTGERGPASVTNSRVVIGPFNPWRPVSTDNESGLQIDQPENAQLTYEKKNELNVGANIGMLNNRLNVEFDYFTRNNFDLIGIINTQGTDGFTSKMGNVAEMKSSGIELAIEGRIIQSDNFSWLSRLNYSHFNTEVTKLNTRSRMIDLITGTGFAREGAPERGLYSIPFVRLTDEGLPVFIGSDNTETTTGIYFQERDLLDFLKYEGPTNPTDIGGFSNTFTYKNFSLGALISYSFGNVVRLNPVFRNGYSDLVATPKEFSNRWMVPGDESQTNVPVIPSRRQNNVYGGDLQYAYNSYNYSTVRTAKGDFIRLRDVYLTYSLPKDMVNRWKLNNMSVRLNASNLFLIYADKKLNGQDPEFVNSGGVASPIPRQFTMTLRVGL